MSSRAAKHSRYIYSIPTFRNNIRLTVYSGRLLFFLYRHLRFARLCAAAYPREINRQHNHSDDDAVLNINSRVLLREQQERGVALNRAFLAATNLLVQQTNRARAQRLHRNDPLF